MLVVVLLAAEEKSGVRLEEQKVMEGKVDPAGRCQRGGHHAGSGI